MATNVAMRLRALGGLVVALATLVTACQTHKDAHGIERDVPHVEGELIVFSQAFRERAGITMSPVTRADLRPTLRLTGTVSLNPSHVAVVGTRVRGTVRRTFKVEGDEVKAGDALAEIESAELGEAQSGVLQAEAALYAADINAKRERDLLGRSLTTAREAEVAETELVTRKAALTAASQRVRAYGGGAGGFGIFVVRSPIAGHVVTGHLSPGQSVDATNTSFKVADIHHLWVELSVFEKDLPSLRVGDDVTVSPAAEPDVRIAGKVAHVGEVIDATTRSTDVRITVDDPPYHLRPGQSVVSLIATQATGKPVLLVPQEAVVYVDGKSTVFVAEGDTKVRVAPVKVGRTDGTRLEVLEGLSDSQSVATKGVFALKSELYR